MATRPFKIEVPTEVLDDLKRRLKHTRWPDELNDSGWLHGTSLAYIKTLCEYWMTEFEWRSQEAVINNVSHFRADVEGLGIHFVHERGKGKKPIPLIITHGWPSTFFELLKIIPLLTDPAGHGGDPDDSFDVVVPSLPGYGFSDRPPTGMNISAIAHHWNILMTRELGYDTYATQGGDWGACVSARLGFDFPNNVTGVHLNTDVLAKPYLGPGAREMSDKEKAYCEEIQLGDREDRGFAHVQATKPQTLAYALNDSPAGLAAWIVEKFRNWSDCGGDVEKVFSKDELLTNITIYWVTQTISSSIRIYYEALSSNPWALEQGERVEVPCALALFPKDPYQVVREWAERSLNIHRWTQMPMGGHFAAMEQPELLVDDIRAFFRDLRK